MNNILDLVYDYSKNFRILDLFAIDKIMSILLQENELDTISCELISDNNIFLSHKELGYFANNTICLYINNLRKKVLKDKHILFEKEKNLPLFQYILRQNLEILHTLFHEVEHAIQDKILSENNDKDLERKLLRIEKHFIDNALNQITFYDTIEMIERYIPGLIEYHKDMKIYKTNYDISIMERLADANSLTKIKNMLEQIKKEIPELYELEDDVKLQYLMKSYKILNKKHKNKEIIISPTEEFIKNLGYINSLNKLNIGNLTYDDRFKYGLQITKEEYENNTTRLKKLMK